MTPTNSRRAFLQSGVVLTVAGLISAEGAWLHMRQLAQAYGVICGSASALAHCPQCYVSAALIAAGAASLALAQIRPAQPA